MNTLAICAVAAGIASLTAHANGQVFADFHAVRFDLMTKIEINPANPVPNIWIDTNINKEAVLQKGKVESQKPYHLSISFTDGDEIYEHLEISKISITYDDGKREPNTQTLNLPYRIQPKPIRTINSIDGGKIVRGKVSQISGKLSKVITRDESFKLEMEGHFKAKDGRKITFAVDYVYGVMIEMGKKPLIDS